MSGEEDIRVIKSNNGEETFVFEPYNPLNKRITDKEVCNILRKYGVNVPIYNMELYKRAFIHRSYTKRPDLENKENNIYNISINNMKSLIKSGHTIGCHTKTHLNLGLLNNKKNSKMKF